MSLIILNRRFFYKLQGKTFCLETQGELSSRSFAQALRSSQQHIPQFHLMLLLRDKKAHSLRPRITREQCQ